MLMRSSCSQDVCVMGSFAFYADIYANTGFLRWIPGFFLCRVIVSSTFMNE